MKPREAYYVRKHLKANRNGTELYGSCRACMNSSGQDVKAWAVAYKGGKCTVCGYNRCHTALEFHHRDPSQKDFGISRRKYARDDKTREEIRLELDKCDLLCSICHRELHAGIKKKS